MDQKSGYLRERGRQGIKCAGGAGTKKVGLDSSVHVCSEDIKVTKSFTYLGLARKSLDGLAWTMALWTYSSGVYGIVNIYADR